MTIDYKSLHKKGLEYIQEFGHHQWTDYNTHDPGVTILEYLCYALSDLTSRTNLPIKDLLVADLPLKGETRYRDCRPLHLLHDSTEETDRFHYAHDILPCRTSTLNDYRKNLIDINGIDNAWIDIAPKEIDPSISEKSPAQNIAVKGFYNVKIKFKSGTDSHTKKRLFNEARQILNNGRNLCESFQQVQEASCQDVHLKVIIDLDVDVDVADVAAKCAYNLENYITPPIRFYSQIEMQKKGHELDEIFNGPLLEHGFIDSEELDVSSEDVLLKSEIRKLLLASDGVIRLKNLVLSGSKQANSSPTIDSLNLDQDASYFTLTHFDCSFMKSGREYRYEELQNEERFKEKLRSLQVTKAFRQPFVQDIAEPDSPGNIDEIIEYTSIQNHFPPLYGIGHEGLADSTSNERKAYAKQLKAYLLVFEQFMADYLAQLAHVKDLFSMESCNHTYHAQLVKDCPGIDELLRDRDSFEGKLQNFAESEDEFLERRNHFLDHLLARFSEHIDQHDFYRATGHRQEDLKRLIIAKQAFLKKYVSVSSNRAGAYDYSKSLTPDNTSGLERRIRHLLGMDGRDLSDLFIRSYERNEFAQIDEYRFYLKDDDDKVLLSSKGHYLNYPDLIQAMDQVREYGQNIKNYYPKKIKHGEYAGEFSFTLEADESRVLAEHPFFYDSKETCENAIDETIEFFTKFSSVDPLYVLEHILLLPDAEDKSASHPLTNLPYLQGSNDPYSFQISAVLSKSSDFFKHQDLVEDLINENTPAHIIPYVVWLSDKQMKEFEPIYFEWAEYYEEQRIGLDNAANDLVNFLSACICRE